MSRILFLLTLLAVGVPASAVEVGRSKVDHPALGTVGGSALHSSIETIFTTLSDNANSRYEEFGGLSNSQTVELDHNFGASLTELQVLIYTGTTANLTRVTEQSSPALSEYTIAEKTGSEKQIIEITTPASGSPSQINVVVVHNTYNLDDIYDVDLTGVEDGQSVVYSSSTNTWGPGSSGDSSFKIQSVTDTSQIIKGGQYDAGDGRQLASYDGAGTASTDFRKDLDCDFDAILGSAPALDTIYLVYIDLNSVGTSPTTTSDTKEELYPVECSDIALLTSFPEDSLSSRYVRVGRVHSATAAATWDGAGSSFGTFATRIQARPVINTSPIVYSLAQQDVESVGEINQIVGGHELAESSFNNAADKSWWGLSDLLDGNTGNAHDLTNTSVTFDGTDINGGATASNFDSTGDALHSTDAFVTTDLVSGDWTIGGFAKVANWATSNRALFAIRANGSEFVAQITTTGTSVDLIVLDSTASNTATISIPTSELTNDKYYHFAMVWEDGVGLTGYLNGTKYAFSDGITDIDATAPTHFTLGNLEGASFGITGQLDEWKVQHAALSSGEVRKLASKRIDHNQNIPIADQQWISTFSGNFANQLDSGWIVDKSTNSIWFDFFDLDESDEVSIKLKYESATAHAIPLKTFDTGFLSAAPSFPLSHGLGQIPTAVEVIHENQTAAGDFDSVKHLCSWDDAQITCAGLNVVDGTNRLRIVISAANVAAAIGVASTTDSGIVTTGTQSFAGSKSIVNGGTLLTPDPGADDLILQDTVNTSGFGGLTIFGDTAGASNIYFGDSGSPFYFFLQGHHGQDSLNFGLGGSIAGKWGGNGNLAIGSNIASAGGRFEVYPYDLDQDTFVQFGTLNDNAGIFGFDQSGALKFQLSASGVASNQSEINFPTDGDCGVGNVCAETATWTITNGNCTSVDATTLASRSSRTGHVTISGVINNINCSAGQLFHIDIPLLGGTFPNATSGNGVLQGLSGCQGVFFTRSGFNDITVNITSACNEAVYFTGLVEYH